MILVLFIAHVLRPEPPQTRPIRSAACFPGWPRQEVGLGLCDLDLLSCCSLGSLCCLYGKGERHDHSARHRWVRLACSHSVAHHLPRLLDDLGSLHSVPQAQPAQRQARLGYREGRSSQQHSVTERRGNRGL